MTSAGLLGVTPGMGHAQDHGSLKDQVGEPARKPEHRLRIVVADDDAEMRSLLRTMLRTLDAALAEVATGDELLGALADDGPFDLVITDVRMPAPSGLQVVSMARAAGVETPFVVITAFPDDQLRASVEKLGGAVMLAKPFGRGELLAAARRLVRRP